jgi:hypothetical protein
MAHRPTATGGPADTQPFDLSARHAELLDEATIGQITRAARQPDGRWRYDVRCRLPFQFRLSAPGGQSAARLRQLRGADDSDWRAGVRALLARPDLDARAKEQLEAALEEGSKWFLLEGIASSTSVDWYGTEMTREALDQMAAQMSSEQGVAITNSHWWTPWYQVMGQTHARPRKPKPSDVGPFRA